MRLTCPGVHSLSGIVVVKWDEEMNGWEAGTLEAGWIGRLVIELGNLADLPLRVYATKASARWSSSNQTKTAR
jgi:hypothetical protein